MCGEFKCEACNGESLKDYEYPIGKENRLAIERKKFTLKTIALNNVKFLIKTFVSKIPGIGLPRLRTLRNKTKGGYWLPFTYLKMLEHNLETCATYFTNKKIRVCQHCGFGAVFPSLSEQMLVDYYQNSYWHATDRILAPCENRRTSTIYDIVEEIIPFEELRYVIEFGSASAQLSRFFKQKWPQLEISVIESGENWQKLLQEETKSIFSNIRDVNDKYDLFLSSHSLEHIPDLHDYFNLITGIIRDNGFLVIEVPNCEEASVIFDKDNPDYHIPHTYFFTPHSFVHLAKRYGFELIFTKTFNKSYYQMLNNINTRSVINGTIENPKGAYLRVLMRKLEN